MEGTVDMWSSYFEMEQSILDGSEVRVPALKSDNGAVIIRRGYLPEGVRVVEYKRDTIHIRISMTRYDGDGQPVPILTVFLSTALRGLVTSRQIDACQVGIARESIMSDLKEALIGWDDLIDPTEPPIQNIAFT
jgi:hypothetical protein